MGSAGCAYNPHVNYCCQWNDMNNAPPAVNSWYGANYMPMGDGNTYYQFLVMHAIRRDIWSQINVTYAEYSLNGSYTKFTALIGQAQSPGIPCSSGGYSWYYNIYVDGDLKGHYGPISLHNQTESIEIDVTGGNILRLEVTPDGSNGCDQAALVNPLLETCMLRPSYSTNINKLMINDGAFPSEKSDFCIAELIVFNDILNLTEIECVEQYFNEKYLLPTISPSTIPTNNPSYVYMMII